MDNFLQLLKNSDLPHPIHDVQADTLLIVWGKIQAIEIPLNPVESKKYPHRKKFRIIENYHVVHELDHRLAFLIEPVRQLIYKFILENKYIQLKRFGSTVGVSMTTIKSVIAILLDMKVIAQTGTYYRRSDEWYDYIHQFINPERIME